MKFPVLSNGEACFPNIARCPQCKRAKIFEPNSFACLNGGAFLMDRKRKSGKRDDRLSGFISIIWHGAHAEGSGVDPEIYEDVELADDCRGGQFDLYFCTIKCLRAFLNSWVDALEDKVDKARRSRCVKAMPKRKSRSR